jgi:hypothetical protein
MTIEYGACALNAGWQAVDTHTQDYVMRTAFPRQKWLRERTPLLRHTYTVSLALINIPQGLQDAKVLRWVRPGDSGGHL